MHPSLQTSTSLLQNEYQNACCQIKIKLNNDYCKEKGTHDDGEVEECHNMQSFVTPKTGRHLKSWAKKVLSFIEREVNKARKTQA